MCQCEMGCRMLTEGHSSVKLLNRFRSAHGSCYLHNVVTVVCSLLVGLVFIHVRVLLVTSGFLVPDFWNDMKHIDTSVRLSGCGTFFPLCNAEAPVLRSSDTPFLRMLISNSFEPISSLALTARWQVHSCWKEVWMKEMCRNIWQTNTVWWIS